MPSTQHCPCSRVVRCQLYESKGRVSQEKLDLFTQTRNVYHRTNFVQISKRYKRLLRTKRKHTNKQTSKKKKQKQNKTNKQQKKKKTYRREEAAQLASSRGDTNASGKAQMKLAVGKSPTTICIYSSDCLVRTGQRCYQRRGRSRVSAQFTEFYKSENPTIY